MHKVTYTFYLLLNIIITLFLTQSSLPYFFAASIIFLFFGSFVEASIVAVILSIIYEFNSDSLIGVGLLVYLVVTLIIYLINKLVTIQRKMVMYLIYVLAVLVGTAIFQVMDYFFIQGSFEGIRQYLIDLGYYFIVIFYSTLIYILFSVFSKRTKSTYFKTKD